MARSTKIGARVRQAREKAGLTQAQLGEAIGHDQQWIHKIESGVIKRLHEEDILKIAEKTGVAPGWLALGVDKLDQVSDEALQVAVHYDALPAEERNKILTTILRIKASQKDVVPEG